MHCTDYPITTRPPVIVMILVCLSVTLLRCESEKGHLCLCPH